MFGYACALTRGDQALADDLVHAAFMAAAWQWPAVRCLCPARRRGWLQTTIGHLAISAFGRNAAFDDRLPRVEALFRPAPADTHADAVPGILVTRESPGPAHGVQIAFGGNADCGVRRRCR